MCCLIEVLTEESQQKKQHSKCVRFQLRAHSPAREADGINECFDVLCKNTPNRHTHLYQTYLIRMITEGVWAMAPTRLQAQITHRKMRKASWQPGVGHFPGVAVACSLTEDTQPHPVRFCEETKTRGFIQEPFGKTSKSNYRENM